MGDRNSTAAEPFSRISWWWLPSNSVRSIRSNGMNALDCARATRGNMRFGITRGARRPRCCCVGQAASLFSRRRRASRAPASAVGGGAFLLSLRCHCLAVQTQVLGVAHSHSHCFPDRSNQYAGWADTIYVFLSHRPPLKLGYYASPLQRRNAQLAKGSVVGVGRGPRRTQRILKVSPVCALVDRKRKE